MLTIFTQAAIAVLQEIHFKDGFYMTDSLLTQEELDKLLQQLEAADLIRPLPKPALLSAGASTSLNTTSSEVTHHRSLVNYELVSPLLDLSLLDLLQAIGEPIYCCKPTPDSFNSHYGPVAHKIGVLNHMARLFLSDIKIVDW